MDDVDQIGLRGHHRFDVLAGHRRFVDHFGGLAALDALRGQRAVLNREPAPGLTAAHRPRRAAPCEQAADNPARLPMLPAGGVTTLAVAVMYLSFRRAAITRGFLAAMGLFYVLFAGVLVWLHLQRGVFTGGRP